MKDWGIADLPIFCQIMWSGFPIFYFEYCQYVLGILATDFIKDSQ